MNSTSTLAARTIPGEGIGWDALRISAGVLLLALCAQIAIPLPFTPVPLTGQTFGVMLIAVFFGARRGAIAAALYLFVGALGLPVFQPYGAPGVARLLGPTAGYLWAYPPAVFVTGWLLERFSPGVWPEDESGTGVRRPKMSALLDLFAALLPGQVLIFISGCAWLAVSAGVWRAVQLGLLPFLPGEIIKIAAAMTIALGLQSAQQR
jgi:biotin transport system substrate-specific component